MAATGGGVAATGGGVAATGGGVAATGGGVAATGGGVAATAGGVAAPAQLLSTGFHHLIVCRLHEGFAGFAHSVRNHHSILKRLVREITSSGRGASARQASPEGGVVSRAGEARGAASCCGPGCV